MPDRNGDHIPRFIASNPGEVPPDHIVPVAMIIDQPIMRTAVRKHLNLRVDDDPNIVGNDPFELGVDYMNRAGLISAILDAILQSVIVHVAEWIVDQSKPTNHPEPEKGKVV